MKTRLAIFVAALLLLPYMGMVLSGAQGEGFSSPEFIQSNHAPTVVTLLALLCYTLTTNLLVTLRSGNNPFKLQRDYFIGVAVGSGVLGWLLVLLNHYTSNWFTTQALDAPNIIAQTLLFALLAPAVLSTRALLGSFAGLLKRLARAPALPALAPDTTAFILVPLALLGLLGGAAWPAQLFWLFWSAPLLLLVALQLLWHESTVFSGLRTGDWGRVLCSALAGLAVGNLSVIVYGAAGGELLLQLPNPLFAQLGYALFGLLCLQLGDVIAENWRGKTRAQVFKKKAFPIPIVVKKN